MYYKCLQTYTDTNKQTTGSFVPVAKIQGERKPGVIGVFGVMTYKVENTLKYNVLTLPLLARKWSKEITEILESSNSNVCFFYLFDFFCLVFATK